MSNSSRPAAFWRACLLALCLPLAQCALARPAAPPADSLPWLLRLGEGQIRYVASDALHQCYALLPDNTLLKYDAKGQAQFHYTDNSLGRLGFVDASNPFNVLLYYPDFKTIVLLDRTLAPTGRLLLFDLGLFEVNAVCSSNNNQIWVYDEVLFRLKKLDAQGQIVYESHDLSLQLGYAPQPSALAERDNQLYMSVPGRGVLIFDAFGNYDSTLPLPAEQPVQVLGHYVVYQQGAQFRSYDMRAFQDVALDVPRVDGAAPQQVALQQGRAFVLHEGYIYIFELNSR